MKLITLILLISTSYISFSKKEPEIELKKVIVMFNKSIHLTIPLTFRKLADHKISSYYSGASSPKLVYSDSSEDVRIAFDSENLSVKESALPVVTKMIEKGLKKMHPKSKWKDQGITDVEGQKIGFIEYLNKKPEKFYEFIFFTSFKGQLIACTFHAPKKGHKPWKAKMREMMQTLKLL
jgi:hypothetical protein